MPPRRPVPALSPPLSGWASDGQAIICAIQTQVVSKDPISSIESPELVTLWHAGCIISVAACAHLGSILPLASGLEVMSG